MVRTPWFPERAQSPPQARSPQRAAPIADSCAAVPERFTEDLAHSILQIHCSCPTDQCARRKAAVFYLYEQARCASPERQRPGH